MADSLFESDPRFITRIESLRQNYQREGGTVIDDVRKELRLPIYLDGVMRRRLERVAKKRSKPVGDLMNQLLKKDLAVLETTPRLHGRGAA